MIGSTANIVALGLIEKNKEVKIDFFAWLKLGFFIGVLGMAIAVAAILLLPMFGLR